MALKVGELFATLKLDDRDFASKMDKSKSSWDGLGSALKTGAKVGAQVFAASATAAVGLGAAAMKVGLSYNRMQQSSRAALSTLLGGAEAANAQMDKLDEFARTSPFSKAVFIEAQRQMIGFGIEAKNVIPALDSIQNAVAAMGGSNADITAIVDSLSKMQSQGRLSGITLKELGQYGIDAAAIIGEKMGKSGAEIREMASKPGGIPVEQIWDPLIDGLADKFGGASALIKEQMDGAADRVKAAFRDIGSIMAAPFIDPNGGGRLVVWTNDLADAMRALEAKVKPLVSLLVERFAPGMDKVTPLFERAEGAINSWDISKVNAQLDSLTKYTPLIAGASAALFAFGTSNLPILSSLGITGINPIVAGLGALIATSPQARDALSRTFESLSPLASVAKDLGSQLADVLVYALETLAPALGDLGVVAGTAGTALLTSLAPAATALLDAGMPLIDVLATVVGWVSDLPGPVTTAAIAMLLMKTNMGLVTTPIRNFGKFATDAAIGTRLHAAAVGEVGLAFSGLGGKISKVGTSLLNAFGGPVGIAIMGVVAALGAFAAKQAEVRAAAEGYKQTLDDLGNKTEETTKRIIDETTRAKAANYLESIFGSGKSALERAEEIGVSADLVVGYINGEEAAVRQLIAATEEFIETGSQDRRERRSNEEAVRRFISVLDDERDALDIGIDAKKRGAELSRDMSDASDSARDAVRRHIDALRDQHDALLEGANASIGQSKALRRQEDAQERTREALKKLNATSKDAEATEQDVERARRDVEAALDDEAASHWDLIGAMERNNATTEDLRAKTRSARDAFVESAIQMGKTRAEAEALADSYGLIPAKINTQVSLETAAAKWQLDEFIRTQSGRVIRVRTELGSGVTTYDYGGGVRARADGGIDVPSYANGKMPHQAIIQAAKPGLVQWAEPETHGEAFIPLAPSKRSRSLAIWEETGRRLGAFTRSFADGGTTGRAPVPHVGAVSAPIVPDAVLASIAAAVREGAREGTAGLAPAVRRGLESIGRGAAYGAGLNTEW